jgi:hypothetical protein
MEEVKSVPQALSDLSQIHDQRGKDYGEDYLHIGEVLAGMFPDGLHLKNRADFNRFALLILIVTKAGRYATCLSQGRGHVDSLDDLSVYAQLLQRFDSIETLRKAWEKAGSINFTERQVPRIVIEDD